MTNASCSASGTPTNLSAVFTRFPSVTYATVGLVPTVPSRLHYTQTFRLQQRAACALLLLVVTVAQGQHGPGAAREAEEARQPLANILLHRQALGTDGAFNYAFRADNGLQQGESIAPDGSRRGAYSYVDPGGRTISVRYTAGKDGFKILDGDPSPGTAAQQQQLRPQPQLAYQAQPQPVYQPQPQAQPVYRPQPQPQVAFQPQPQPAYQPQPQPQAAYRPPPQPQIAFRPQPQQSAAYQAAAAFASTQGPPSPTVAYQPAARPPPLPYQRPVQHAQPAYQVQVTPRPAPAASQGSLGFFRSTAPAAFPQQRQQLPQVQQTPIEEPLEEQEAGPHTFGQGYSFEFQG